jgi:hypothetical protein
MTANVPSPIFNALVTAFFIVVVLAAAIGAYAAVSLKKLEKKAQKD